MTMYLVATGNRLRPSHSQAAELSDLTLST